MMQAQGGWTSSKEQRSDQVRCGTAHAAKMCPDPFMHEECIEWTAIRPMICRDWNVSYVNLQ